MSLQWHLAFNLQRNQLSETVQKSIMRNLRKQFELVIIVGLFTFTSLFLGCGANSRPEKVTGAVEISVTNDGKPVSEGLVQMTIVGKGVYSSSQLDAAGHASLPKVEIGDYVVFITPPSGPAPHASDKPATQKKYPRIPLKFRSERTTTLKAEVKEGKNEFQFELK